MPKIVNMRSFITIRCKFVEIRDPKPATSYKECIPGGTCLSLVLNYLKIQVVISNTFKLGLRKMFYFRHKTQTLNEKKKTRKNKKKKKEKEKKTKKEKPGCRALIHSSA